jgi:Secretion system C-terminal sorting domain
MLKTSHYKIKLLTLAMVFGTTSIMAANNTAVTSGAWETGSNWSLGTVPVATDNVTIPAGLTITVKVAADVCGNLSVASTGTLIINAACGLSVAGNLNNAGSFMANATSTLTFNGAITSTITGGGTYLVTGTVVLNMVSKTTLLDVQDANFIAGINAGGKYFVNFKRGTWKMNNAGTLNDCYNVGSTNALTIPFSVVIESDAGTMNLGRNAPTGNVILSGELNINGGVINIQLGQAFNSGQDFQYHVNGGTPQLYISGGSLNIGAGFNANAVSDFIDFHMTGGTMIVALNGYSNWITFQLADVVGGKTFMSGGTIILQDATNANIEDLDMGGANVAATQYSVTGGTVQLGYISSQSSASFFGINAQPATNYPNIDFEAGVAKNVSAFTGGNINMLSLYVNPNMTFDATGFPNVTIMANNGSFAFDDEGGFIQGTNTVTFTGSVPQLITSTTLTNEVFYNLAISNTSGNVRLGVPTTVSNLLSFTSGRLDASNFPLTLSAGNVAVTGASATSYIITGDGVTTTGLLNIANIPSNLSTLLPVGTTNYYLPVSINPGTNTGNGYSIFVFNGATTNALANGPAFPVGTLSKMLNAEWNVSRTAGSGNASIILNWISSGTALEGSAFQGYGLNIGIAQYSSGSWQGGIGSGNIATQTATATFSSFSQFTVVGDGVILPTILVDFEAYPNNNQSAVLLSWTLSEGINIHEFEIERSADGKSWNTLGTLESGSLLSTQISYSMIDSQPATGTNYYRLKMFNPDGRMEFSRIRMVTVSPTIDIRVFPNPANSVIQFYVKNNSSDLVVRLVSPQGQILQQSTSSAGNAVPAMNISKYPTGMYMIQIISAKTSINTNLLFISH